MKLHFSEFGSGDPVILLHGGLANSNYWGFLIPELAKTYRVIALDTRGHGKSTFSKTPFTYSLMAQDVISVMNKVDIDSASIVGWSDGAIVGLELGLIAPQRIRKMFLFGANYNLSGLIPSGSHSQVFAAYQRRTAVEYRSMSPNPGDYSSLLTSLGIMWKREPNYTTAQLGRIPNQVAVSDGAYDEIIFRAHIDKLAASIVGAELLIQPNVSHFAMLQNPVQFNQQVVSFLRA